MAEDRQLPGYPKKRLVRDVRRHLWSYGMRPTSSKLWRETWLWANHIRLSYVFPRWPLASEIGAQYVVLLLLEMGDNRQLKLPHRAMQHIPPSMQQRIEGNPLPMIEMKPREIESHVAPSPATDGEQSVVQNPA